MKALKKALVAVLGAVLGCWFFVGCLSTKLSVTYMVDGETYRVQEYELDTKVTLPTPPTKDGYTFIGWYTDPGLTIPYAEGNVTAGFTLYAKFSVSSVYIVVNTAGGNKIDPIEVAPGTDYTVPEAEKEGYTFLGYTYIDENGEEQLFPLSGKYPSSVGIKITAKYEVNKYTVTFVGAGSSEQEVAYGTTATAPATEKPGYTFDGWYTSETEQTDETKFDLETEITEDITLYAKYTAKSYNVTVALNGGTFANAADASVAVTYDSAYTLAEPTRAGYTFVGYTLENGATFATSGTYTIADSVIVSAKWQQNTYTVTYKDFDTDAEITKVENLVYGDAVPSVPAAAAGYEIVNAYLADKTTVLSGSEEITDNTVVYVKYQPKEYEIAVNGAQAGYENIKVRYGETYTLPTPDKGSAYEFKGFLLDGKAFPATGTYTWTVNITITVDWKTDKVEIQFYDGEVEFSDLTIAKDYNDDITGITLPKVPEKAGYTADGKWYTDAACTTEFVANGAITSDIKLYANYTANDYTITYFDGSEHYELPVTYGEEYTLPTLEKPGYSFLGYELLSGTKFDTKGTYNVVGDTTVKTVWKENKVLVTFNSYEKSEGVETLKDCLVNEATPANKPGHNFDGWYLGETKVDLATWKPTEDETTLTAKYTANTYKVTIEKWENGVKVSERVVEVKYGEYLTGVPATQEPTELYTFDGYYYGATKFDVTAKYETEGDITLVEKWNLREDLSLFEYNKDGNYFTEREDYTSNWTYVFVVTSTPYTFAEGVVLDYVNNADAQYATLSGNTLTATAVGTFTVQITQGSSVITRTFKTVEYIQSMSIAGTTYDTAWGLNENGKLKRNYTGVWDATFTEGAEAMKVGKTNFIPELNYNGKVSAANGNFTATVTVNDVETTDYTINNGSINFGNSLVGKRAVVTIKPKYAVEAKHQAVYEVEINNAVNVYSHEDLKAAFANTAVKEVNILRDIMPTLSTSETMEYVDEHGTPQRGPINYERLINPNTGEYYKTKYSTGVYVRRTGGIAINGNYFTVDGRNLPLVDPRTAEEDDIHKPGSYGILDNRFSIFLFGRRHHGDRSSHRIDNLNIIGNANLNAEASYDFDGVKVLKYSGSVINVHVAGGTLDMTNVSSRLASMALYGYTESNFADACGVVINAKDCIFDKSWANNFYVQGFVDATFDSCYFGQANGASIHVDTLPSTVAMDAAMRLINGTDIQNWVTGLEAWFVGQNLTGAIPQVQVGIDSAVHQASGGTYDAATERYTGGARTILKDGKMNFAMMVRRKDGAADWIEGKDATGKGWMAYTDAYYQGYLQSKYIGQGALNVTMDSLFDLGYAGFMQAMAGTYYSGDQVKAYGGQIMTKKFVMAPNDSPLGYMEFYLELSDNK